MASRRRRSDLAHRNLADGPSLAAAVHRYFQDTAEPQFGGSIRGVGPRRGTFAAGRRCIFRNMNEFSSLPFNPRSPVAVGEQGKAELAKCPVSK